MRPLPKVAGPFAAAQLLHAQSQISQFLDVEKLLYGEHTSLFGGQKPSGGGLRRDEEIYNYADADGHRALQEEDILVKTINSLTLILLNTLLSMLPRRHSAVRWQ